MQIISAKIASDRRIWVVMGLTKAHSTNGQFSKGFSGNPGGRPRDEQKVAELARSYTREAIETLVELMRSGNGERVRGTAAQASLDRGWGKPKVEVVRQRGWIAGGCRSRHLSCRSTLAGPASCWMQELCTPEVVACRSPQS